MNWVVLRKNQALLVQKKQLHIIRLNHNTFIKINKPGFSSASWEIHLSWPVLLMSTISSSEITFSVFKRVFYFPCGLGKPSSIFILRLLKKWLVVLGLNWPLWIYEIHYIRYYKNKPKFPYTKGMKMDKPANNMKQAWHKTDISLCTNNSPWLINGKKF